jgi:hypothetical protein
MMGSTSVTCWSCGHSWAFSPPLGRGDLCQQCRRDAKVCLNCKFYDRHASRECVESQAEVVKDKEKSNFCDWFDARSGGGAGRSASSENPLDALFGTAPTAKPKSKLEEEFEAFFGKKS